MKTLEGSKRDSAENSNPTTQLVYRAGIIGCGRIGTGSGFDRNDDTHLNAYLDCGRTQLVGLCDVSPRYPFSNFLIRLTVSGDAVLVCEDYTETAAWGLDMVSVCTPVETHCNIVCDVAPYVKAIYCEKPMATTLEECDRMIDVCAEHDTILQINHQRRFVKPLFRFSRDLIDTGTHCFDWLAQHDIDADIEYVDTQEHIFELVVTRERMILAGVEWLVGILDGDHYEKSDGWDGYMALKHALEFKDGLRNNS